MERAGGRLLEHLDGLDALISALHRKAASEEHLAQASVSIDALRDEAQAMLDSIRCKHGYLSLQPQAVDLRVLTQQALDELASRALLGIKVPFGPFQCSQAAMAWVDPLRYRQLVVALLRHAAAFEPASELRGRCLRAGHGRLTWVLELDVSSLGDDPLDIQGVLARRLAVLLGGKVERLESSDGGAPFRLELNLPQALSSL